MQPQFNLKNLYKWIKNPKNKILPNLILIFAIGFLLLSLNKFIPSGKVANKDLYEGVKEDDIQNYTQEDDYKKRIENQLRNYCKKSMM